MLLSSQAQVQYYSESKQRWMETTVIRIFEQARPTATVLVSTRVKLSVKKLQMNLKAKR